MKTSHAEIGELIRRAEPPHAILVDPADIERVRSHDAGVTYGLKGVAKLLGAHLETAAACVKVHRPRVA